jgi:hypothetical protein
MSLSLRPSQVYLILMQFGFDSTEELSFAVDENNTRFLNNRCRY